VLTLPDELVRVRVSRRAGKFRWREASICKAMPGGSSLCATEVRVERTLV